MRKKTQNKLGISTAVLLVSGLLCKVIGALFRLPLTNLLGIEGIGVFQLIMSLYAFALVLTCGGVTNALSKLIGTARARNNRENIAIYLKRAMSTSVIIGFCLGILFFCLGGYISTSQGISGNKSYCLFVILLPLGAGLATFRGFFQGFENMLPTAISQVIEQVFKFVFGLMFAFYFGKIGTAEGVFGAFLGIVLSELISICFLFMIFLKQNRKNKILVDMKTVKFVGREFDKANFSIMLSASILPLINAFDGMIIVPRLNVAGLSNGLATKLFGVQAGVVGAILNFPLIISMAVTTTLLPNISYLISRGAGGQNVIEKGLKTLLLMILPTTFGVVAISKEILPVIYADMTGEILNTAFELMFYGAFNIVFTAIMQYCVMLLQANGKFRFILIITAVGGILKATISFFLSAIPSINIFALVLGNIVLSTTISILSLWKLKRILFFNLKFPELFTILFGTAVMFATVYTFINCNYFHVILNVLISIILGVAVYFVVTIPLIVKIIPKNKKKIEV